MSREVVESIEREYRRYKALAESAMEQLDSVELCSPTAQSDNSITTLVRHVSGNLRSRFTEFLSSDGEKPWRERESEFAPREVSREELERDWKEGWEVLFATLAVLGDRDLGKTVSIRGVPLTVTHALHRSLAHASYHVGQIVYLAKSMRGEAWRHLSIPPGESEAYRQNPGLERSLNHREAGSTP